MDQKLFEPVLLTSQKSYRDLMPQLIADAEAIEAECKDYTVKDLKECNLEIDYNDNISFQDFMDSRVTFRTTDHSLHQFCEKLGMPYKYYRALQEAKAFKETKYRLAKNNIETLCQCYDKEVLFRTYRDYVRGTLSTRYIPYDSDKITKDIDYCFTRSNVVNNMIISSYINNPERLHIRFIDTTPIRCSDDTNIYCGITVNSSDVGLSMLGISFYIYESIDSNGICVKVMPETTSSLLAQRHIGKTTEDEIRDKISEDIKDFPNLSQNIRHYIEDASERSLRASGLYNPKSYNGRKLLNDLRITGSQPVQKFMDIISRRPLTLWGYITGITEYAEDLPFKERINLEHMAGLILTRPQDFGLKAEV